MWRLSLLVLFFFFILLTVSKLETVLWLVHTNNMLTFWPIRTNSLLHYHMVTQSSWVKVSLTSTTHLLSFVKVPSCDVWWPPLSLVFFFSHTHIRFFLSFFTFLCWIKAPIFCLLHGSGQLPPVTNRKWRHSRWPLIVAGQEVEEANLEGARGEAAFSLRFIYFESIKNSRFAACMDSYFDYV